MAKSPKPETPVAVVVRAVEVPEVAILDQEEPFYNPTA